MDDLERRGTPRMRWLLVALVGFTVLGGATGFVVWSAQTDEDTLFVAARLLSAVLSGFVIVWLLVGLVWWKARRGVARGWPPQGIDHPTHRRVMRALQHGTPPEDPEERLLATAVARHQVAVGPLFFVAFPLLAVSGLLSVWDEEGFFTGGVDAFFNALMVISALMFFVVSGLYYRDWRRARAYLATHDVSRT